jgi:hypothetical protein
VFDEYGVDFDMRHTTQGTWFPADWISDADEYYSWFFGDTEPEDSIVSPPPIVNGDMMGACRISVQATGGDSVGGGGVGLCDAAFRRCTISLFSSATLTLSPSHYSVDTHSTPLHSTLVSPPQSPRVCVCHTDARRCCRCRCARPASDEQETSTIRVVDVRASRGRFSVELPSYDAKYIVTALFVGRPLLGAVDTVIVAAAREIVESVDPLAVMVRTPGVLPFGRARFRARA